MLNNCPICNKLIEIIDIQNVEDTFFHRCNSCNITHMKVPVGTIINDFSDNSIDRYLKLIVLNMVNQLPIHQLYELYICDKEAFTVKEFQDKVISYKQREQNAKQKAKDFSILH